MRVLQGIFFLRNILKGTEKFLKVPLRGTFKNFYEFYGSAEPCNNKCDRKAKKIDFTI